VSKPRVFLLVLAALCLMLGKRARSMHMSNTGRLGRTRCNHWRIEYNRERPHSSLGNLTPEEFAAQAPAPGPILVGRQFSAERGAERLLTEHDHEKRPALFLESEVSRDEADGA
jgi:hypothetical protein